MLTDLNQNQIKCVSCASGPVVVIAGAGTGKTTVLTKRIAYLIKHMHFNPYEILAITFTNKAANEMRNRVAKLLENEANGITIGTFHSLCLRILRVEIATIGNFNANFNVIDEEEQITIINDLIHDFKISLGKRQFTAKKIRAVISEAKRKGINLEEINDYGKMKALGVYDFDELKVIKLINIQYHKKLMENNLLDFDDLIIFVLAIFDEHPEIVNKWSNFFKYILVDEFQDTDKNQFRIIKYLVNAQLNNIFVVGDEDQTIYTWRGAYPEIFREFYLLFPDTQTYILDLNYRSSKKILQLSNTLINHNQRLHEKALITTNEAGEKIILYHGVNEAKFIAKKIKELVASGEFKYEDIAILYRNNTLSRSIENELANARIPYYIYGGLRFYQRREIKDLLAYLRLMVNFNDELSLKRVINVPKRGIGLARIAVLTNYALQNHCTFADAMRASHDDDIVQFLNLIDGFRFQTKDLTVSETLIYIMEKIKYQDFLKDQDDDFDARSENIDELISSIQIYEQNAADPHDINAYLQEIALYTDVSKKKERNLDTVSLMTIHIAKGSEYPVVFIAGINDGILPSGKAENISEERRLFYVAITRAKKLLFLSYSTSYNPRTKADDTKSRFINEIDQNVIEEITDHYQPISDQDTPWFDSHIKQNYRNNYHDQSVEYEIGDVVVHTTFGEGVVIDKVGRFIDVAFKAPHGHQTVAADHKAIKRKLVV